jgi:hypothetical protein
MRLVSNGGLRHQLRWTCGFCYQRLSYYCICMKCSYDNYWTLTVPTLHLQNITYWMCAGASTPQFFRFKVRNRHCYCQEQANSTLGLRSANPWHLSLSLSLSVTRTRRIMLSTRVRSVSLSSILILSSHLRLCLVCDSFLQVFRRNIVRIVSSPTRASFLAHLLLPDLIAFVTECRGRVVGSPASYSGGPVFVSQLL